MRKLFSFLPKNTKVCISLEPMWAIFGTIVLFYAPLYMKAIGLNEVEIGLISSINLYFGAMFQFIAGSITNKYGRKKTTFIFDMLSWSIPMVIWFLAQNFWYFVIAAIVNATSKIVTVSFNCLIIEDVEEKNRSKVYGILNVIICAGGLLTPIAGLIMSKLDLVPTMRILYICGALLMTLMFILRNKLVNETRAGKELINRHEGKSIVEGIKTCLSNVKAAMKYSGLRTMAVVYIVSSYVIQMNNFLVIFYKESLGFSEYQLSFIPVVGAIANIIFYIHLIKKANTMSDEKYLNIGLFINVVSTLAILIIPKGNISILLLISIFLAVSNLVIQTFRDSVLINRINELEKADMLSAIQTLTTLMIIPSGYASGLLYNHNPYFLFITMGCLNVFTLIILLNQGQLKYR